MNMSDMKNTIKSFLSGDLKAETETMFSGLGFEKKAEAKAPEPETPPILEPKVDVDAITTAATEAGKIESHKSAMDQITEILNMCALAGKMDKAVEMISSGATIETIRKQLIDAKAEEQKGSEIKNNISPLTTGDVNPVIAEAIRRRDAAKTN